MSRKDFQLLTDISVDDLKLDTGNARIRAGRDQNECMAKILRKEDQMLKLMESIATDGLTTMPIIVRPLGAAFVVMDGNRRVTALKLLNQPDSCPVDHLKARIKGLQKKHAANIPAVVDVLSSTSEEAIAQEVLSRHRGAADGAGQLNWSAYLRTVFLLNHGHPAEYKRPGQYAMWAEAQGIVVDDEFPITNLQRFFSKDNLALLGFNVTKDQLVPARAVDEVRRMADIVVRDFGVGRKNVSTVFEPEQGIAYIRSVLQEAGLTDPTVAGRKASSGASASQAGQGASQGTADTDAGGGGAGAGGAGGATGGHGATANRASSADGGADQGASETGAKNGSRAASTPKNHPGDRTKLFGTKAPNIPIPPDEIKAAAIVAELRRLDLKGQKGTPYAAAFLLRGLLEVSDRFYRTANKLKDKNSLAPNVRASADHMFGAGLLDKSQLDIVIRYAGGADTLLQIENLQKMLHRETHIPDHHKLNTIWDELGCFVRACWGK